MTHRQSAWFARKDSSCPKLVNKPSKSVTFRDAPCEIGAKCPTSPSLRPAKRLRRHQTHFQRSVYCPERLLRGGLLSPIINQSKRLLLSCGHCQHQIDICLNPPSSSFDVPIGIGIATPILIIAIFRHNQCVGDCLGCCFKPVGANKVFGCL